VGVEEDPDRRDLVAFDVVPLCNGGVAGMGNVCRS
jgi:hypothetical protein